MWVELWDYGPVIRARIRQAVFVVFMLVLAACGSTDDVAADAGAQSVPDRAALTQEAPASQDRTDAPAESADDPVDTEPTREPAPTSSTSAPTDDAQPATDPTSVDCEVTDPAEGRTDIVPSGNHLVPGGIDILTAPVVVSDLPAPATWIVRSFASDTCTPEWYVTLADGQAVLVDHAGQVTDAGAAVVPPETSPASITTAHHRHNEFENPLVDSRVVSFDRWSVALVDPTDRYGHGVLGDRIEAGGIEILDTSTGESTRIIIDAPSVIEGISPILVDVDNDDRPEILVTQSNNDVGAWLVLYDIDGTLRAESDPIGRGNRWRNQLGGGFVGPNGEFEIVDIRTPHLDGVVEFFRVEGDRLERVTTTTGYTTHELGSRNLDLGVFVDTDFDGFPEVLVPSRDLGSLAVIDRNGDDAVEVGRIDLGSRLSTNLAAYWTSEQTWLAAGTTDGRLIIWGDAP